MTQQPLTALNTSFRVASEMNDNDFGVVVGISQYPALGDLDGPVNDAINFYDWLVSPGRGGVPEENVKMILSPDPVPTKPMTRRNAIPTRDQIINAFEKILEREDKRGKVGRRFYMYLAGHGFAPEVDDAALLMANASHRFLHSIPGRPYARWLRAAAKFDELVLLMDCCRDDYRNVPPQPPPWREEHSSDADEVKYFYVFATQTYQKAGEDTMPKIAKVQGIFTTAFLAGLKMAEPDKEGNVWGESIEKYTINYMLHLKPDGKYQEPEFVYEKTRDIVFLQRDAPRKICARIHFKTVTSGKIIVIDGDLKTIHEGSIPPSKILELNLELGRYRIQELTSNNFKRFDVFGSPEEEFDVEF